MESRCGRFTHESYRQASVIGHSLQARWNIRLSAQERGARALADVPAGTTPPDEVTAAKLKRELLVLQDEA